MKTKKDIFSWYLSRGNQDTKHNDYIDFVNKAELSISFKMNKMNILTVITKRSQYPIYLYFSKNEHNVLECYKISGY